MYDHGAGEVPPLIGSQRELAQLQTAPETMVAEADQALREAQVHQQQLLRQYRNPAALHEATEYRREVHQRVRSWAGFRDAGPQYVFGARPGCACPTRGSHQCPHCGWEACAACAAASCPRCQGRVAARESFQGPEVPNPENGPS